MLKDNIVLLPVKNDPTVSIKIWVKAGAQNDPRGKEGLAYITAKLLSEGSTNNNSYGKILELLFPLAARYSASSSMEMTVYSGRIHTDNIDEYYPLYIDGILNPAFNDNDLKRVKEETLNYLNTTLKYSNDEELAKAVLYNSIFAGTPYGHLNEGTISGLINITIDDVRSFYNKFYRRNNIVLGLAGNFSEKLLRNLLADLDKLPKSTPVKTPEINPAPISGLNVSIVKKDSDAASISIGFPIKVLRGSKDWYALAIANSWFGEHRSSSSHLYQVLREARGLNYGDYSYIENFPDASNYQMPCVNFSRRHQIFEIWIRPVSLVNCHFALRAALRELTHFVDLGISKENFEITRNFLKKYILHFAPDTETRLGYSLDDKFYGLEDSHIKMFREMMDCLTLEDVNNAIRRHLQYDNMKIVIVNPDADELKCRLAENLSSPAVYPIVMTKEICMEDKEIESFRLNIHEENIEIMSVENLFT